jgi:hypothetical protein
LPAVLQAPAGVVIDFAWPRVFGDRVYARTAMGVAATPLSCPVVIAAELAFRP